MAFKVLPVEKHILNVEMDAFSTKIKNSDFHDKITDMRRLPSDF